MPLTDKGRDILRSMRKQYGSKEGTSVFYASKNAGKITGVDAINEGNAAGMQFGSTTGQERSAPYNPPGGGDYRGNSTETPVPPSRSEMQDDQDPVLQALQAKLMERFIKRPIPTYDALKRRLFPDANGGQLVGNLVSDIKPPFSKKAAMMVGHLLLADRRSRTRDDPYPDDNWGSGMAVGSGEGAASMVGDKKRFIQDWAAAVRKRTKDAQADLSEGPEDNSTANAIREGATPGGNASGSTGAYRSSDRASRRRTKDEGEAGGSMYAPKSLPTYTATTPTYVSPAIASPPATPATLSEAYKPATPSSSNPSYDGMAGIGRRLARLKQRRAGDASPGYEESGVGAESWVHGRKNSTGYEIKTGDRRVRFRDAMRRAASRGASVGDALRAGLQTCGCHK